MIIAKGLVYGHYWGGGGGVFKACDLEGNSRDEIIKKVESSNDLCEFDDGMGFEKVVGVFYAVKEIQQDGEWKKTRLLESFFIDKGMDDDEYLFLQEQFDYIDHFKNE